MAARFSAVTRVLLAVGALALALSLPSFAEARGGRHGIPDSVVGIFGDDSKMLPTIPSTKEPTSSLSDDANPACDVCKWAWTNAQQALADPDTQAQVMRFAEETACGMLPSEEAQKCKEMAREYLPNAIAALESFDADEACGAVGFCPQKGGNGGEGEGESEKERETRRIIREALVASFAFSPRAVSTSTSALTSATRLGGPACPACRLALNSVKLQLEDPANQKQMLDKAHKVRVVGGGRGGGFFSFLPSCSSPSRSLLRKPGRKKKKKVCFTLPADSAELCASAVDDNAAKLFAIVADFDCNTLCVVAGACPPPDPPSGIEEIGGEEAEEEVGEEENDEGTLDLHPTVLSLSPFTSPPPRQQLSDDPVDLCGICTSVLSQLHEAVTDPEKQKEAMATAARVCSALHRFRDECLGDVQQYGPLVINTVGQYVGPDLCAAAGLCSTPSSSASTKEVTKRTDVA